MMLIPVGEDVSVSVTVVMLGSEPDVTTGQLRRLDWDTFRLELSSKPGLSGRPGSASHASVGTRLIVTAGDRTKLPGRVVAVEDGVLVVSRDRTHAADDRSAPRVMGLVRVRWRVADGGAPAWLAGGPDPGPFSEFSGTADVSMSGIRFVATTAVAPVGSQLMLELGLGPTGRDPKSLVPSSEHGTHRLLGLVRRVEHLGGSHALGVEFVDVPEPTLDALSDFTLENL
jgi:hypothetical protein